MKQTIFMTGATGFIGYRMARAILLEKEKAPVAADRLVLLVRDQKKARTFLEKELANTEVEVVFLESSLENLRPDMVFMPIDYIIHCASTTKSGEMVTHPVEVADGIVLGTRNILELAYQKQVKSMVYLSSMEVYGKVPEKTHVHLTTEEELGEIEIGAARSCYPMGKRMAEHYCHTFFKEYDVPVKIARLSQTFGMGVPLEDSRIFAQFAKAVLEERDIVLHTSGMSMGNYCGAEDTMNGLWTILLYGNSGETYNIVNESNTMRICEMAQLVADKVAEGKSKVVYEIEEGQKFGYAPHTELRLSSKKLQSLGWKPVISLEEMYRELIAWYGRRR